ncbi:hypothetical protein K440DRAFT_127213 [Wilcoxina mikolae CBS 423.85]|nr:hypothetical protein K440DRAFT_127213 [Wilcoxina mikolae CBS 423.85]
MARPPSRWVKQMKKPRNESDIQHGAKSGKCVRNLIMNPLPRRSFSRRIGSMRSDKKVTRLSWRSVQPRRGNRRYSNS